MELQVGDTTAEAKTNETATGRALLVVDGKVSQLYQPFSIAAGTATTDIYKDNPGQTSDGKYSVLDALMEHYGTSTREEPVYATVFDEYASEATKTSIERLIGQTALQTGVLVQRIQFFSTPGGGDWTEMPDALQLGSGWYTLLAYAENSLGSDKSFRAIGPVELRDKQWPVVNPSTNIVYSKLGDNGGRITITFNEELYFVERVPGRPQVIKQVTPTALSGSSVAGNWMARSMLIDTMSSGWNSFVETGEPRGTRALVFDCNNVTPGRVNFTIRAGLCDQWGNEPPSDGFNVTVTLVRNAQGDIEISGTPVLSDEWNSTRPQSRPTT